MNLSEIIRDKKDIDLHFNLQLGPAVTISLVEYNGLKRTDGELISRYNKIEIGDTLIQSKITNGLRAIEKAGFIAIDGDPKVIPDPGLNTASLSYNFREIRQFHIEGSGGYIPDDEGYFVWYLNLQGKNIFGGGQNASLLADQREKNRSILSIGYSQPVFLISTGEVQVDFYTRDYREQFYEFGINLGYRFFANNNFSISTLLGWKNVEPSDSMSQSYSNYLAGVGVTIGQINDYRGKNSSYIDWTVNYLSRNYAKSTDSSVGRTVYNDIRNHLTLAGQYSLGVLLSNHHKLVLSDIETSEKPIPYSELSLIGGPGTLRGYRNGQFAVNRSVVLSTETKFFFSDRDYIYPFLDYAYLWQFDTQLKEITIRKLGYGLGFSLYSNERSFKIELSWAKGTAFDQPRIHAVVYARF